MERMNFLAIDTTNNVLKIALLINGKQYCNEIKKGLKHIENLAPAIQNSFKEIGEEKSAINYIGVCIGPGSFTGIRIGVAAVLGISCALNIKCFGFSVFDIYKFLFKEESEVIVIPIIDAKKNRFYCAFIESNDETIRMYDYDLDSIKDKIRTINNKKLIFVGKDFSLIKDEILKDLNVLYKYSDDYACNEIMNFSKWLINSGEKLNEPKPIYLRKSEAELSLLKNKSK